jgi:hypothetical protein
MAPETAASTNTPVDIDELLKQFEDPDHEGHVMLSPDMARDILLKKLLGFYRLVQEGMRQLPDPRIEVLTKIAGGEDQGEMIDYSQAIEEFGIVRNDDSAEPVMYVTVLEGSEDSPRINKSGK